MFILYYSGYDGNDKSLAFDRLTDALKHGIDHCDANGFSVYNKSNTLLIDYSLGYPYRGNVQAIRSDSVHRILFEEGLEDL